MGESESADLEGSFRSTMLAEVRAIIATPEFGRAPVMTRLLDYLAGETLAGRGDQLKAYAVAVDGLGRAPDFDTQGDSYPRVQVGRLRQMLAKFYARHPRGVRLAIPQGSYRVVLEDGAAADEGPALPNRMWRPRRFRGGALILIVALLAAVAVAWAAWRSYPLPPSRPLLVAPPMLELSLVIATRENSGLRDPVRATLLDGLHRTEAIQVKTPRRVGGSDPAPIPSRYRLAADIAGKDRPILFLRLSRVAPDRLIWSDQVALPTDPARLGEALAPTFAALTQASGVIPTAERAERGRSFAPGYPCLLQYEQYQIARRPAHFMEVHRCLKATLDLFPEHAPALAASAMIALDEAVFGMRPAQGEPRTRHLRQKAEALALARRAMASDPHSAFANFALSRASLYAGLCPTAVRSGLRAVKLNPYDPFMFANVGFFLADCDDPRGEALVRQAIALDPNTPGYNAPLVYLAVARGDGAAAREALQRMEQTNPNGKTYYYLAAAIALAADGDVDGARAAWIRLAALDPALARDPDSLFVRRGLSPRIRSKIMAALGQAGLVPPAPSIAPRREP